MGLRIFEEIIIIQTFLSKTFLFQNYNEATSLQLPYFLLLSIGKMQMSKNYNNFSPFKQIHIVLSQLPWKLADMGRHMKHLAFQTIVDDLHGLQT